MVLILLDTSVTLSHSLDGWTNVFTNAEHLVTVVTTFGSGLCGTVVAWYKVKQSVKHAAAEALEAELEDKAKIEACRKLMETQLVSHHERLDAVETQNEKTAADVAQLRTGFAVVVSRIAEKEINDK